MLDIIKVESEDVAHDGHFRIRKTHATPDLAHCARVYALFDFKESKGFRIHDHNLFFYSDIGAGNEIAEYRKNSIWI